MEGSLLLRTTLFLKFNPDAFVAPYIASPTTAGKYVNDTYWLGNSAINYSTVRDPSINNLNFTIRRTFKVTERFARGFSGQCYQPAQPSQYRDLYHGSGQRTNLTPNNTNNIPLGYQRIVRILSGHTA